MDEAIDKLARDKIRALQDFVMREHETDCKMWRLQIRINTISNLAKLIIGIATILSLALSIAALAIAMKGMH